MVSASVVELESLGLRVIKSSSTFPEDKNDPLMDGPPSRRIAFAPKWFLRRLKTCSGDGKPGSSVRRTGTPRSDAFRSVSSGVAPPAMIITR